MQRGLKGLYGVEVAVGVPHVHVSMQRGLKVYSDSSMKDLVFYGLNAKRIESAEEGSLLHTFFLMSQCKED